MRASKLGTSICSVLFALVGCGGSTPPSEQPQAQNEPQQAATATPVASSSDSSPSAEPQPGQPSEKANLDVPPPGASTNRIMQAHFQDALLIRKAVIDGKPEQAYNPATVIANAQSLDGLPPGWRPYVMDMQLVAQRIADTSRPAAVAGSVADLAISCGTCHLQLGGPKPSTEPPPPRGDTLESHMEHHAWATERLWEALSVPSDAAWHAGVKELSTAPFPPDILKQGGVDARSAAADFGKLVAKAPHKKTIQERAALYAELLVTCGTCHQAIENKD
jgi:hypothetical protein